MIKNIFDRYSQLLFYGFCLSILLFLLKWLEWKFLIIENSLDIYIGLIALFFTMLGVWVAKQLTGQKIKTIIVEKTVERTIHEPTDAIAMEQFNLTPRERDVLMLILLGKSNMEIAEQLFLSISTVKTHVSNVFVKMEVKSRTQVMEKAKRLRIMAY
ncbi:response regulator transcription factor [Dyadobacter sp. CY343]|uniref:response regulator transcription factor n=1 Tax=Dyadobacter sp. CY343 TaxID=2907299 RepID=UPI001F3F6EAB|nr:response regulator transcription factor [Dyadobacter sp. CY343]MCE7060796.1 response regulator transcription factor [Dyadobacter sp. CY343]